jgi:hypothetical protein
MAPSNGLDAVAIADTEHLDQSFRELRARRDERDHEAEESHALDVFLAEHTMHCTIREVDDAHELIVIHEREADEGSRREVLVLE